VTEYLGALMSADPPWWYSFYGDPRSVDALAVELEAEPAVVRLLRGSAMRTLDALFDEVATALDFPQYFGRNWDALDECLADLSWLPAPAYVLLISDSIELLADEPPKQFEILLKVLDRVAAEWSRPIAVGQPWDRPAVPFHVTFCETQAGASRLRQRFEEGGFALTSLPPS
jgi:RNAse (barnase) inhibitor barstar